MGDALYREQLPNWKRGGRHILFVMREFRKLEPAPDGSDVTPVGHSDCGDMDDKGTEEQYERICRDIPRRIGKRWPGARSPYALLGCFLLEV